MSTETPTWTWPQRGVMALLAFAAAPAELATIRHVYARSSVQVTPAAAHAADVPGRRSPMIDITRIISAHLFGGHPSMRCRQPTSRPSPPTCSAACWPVPTAATAWRSSPMTGTPRACTRSAIACPAVPFLRAVYPRTVVVERAGESITLQLPRRLTGALLASLGLPGGDDQLDMGAPEASEAQQRREFEDVQRLSELKPAPVVNVLMPNPIVIDGALLGYELAPPDPTRSDCSAVTCSSSSTGFR